MKDALLAFLISLATSVAVLFTLGPVMLEMNQVAPAPPPAVAAPTPTPTPASGTKDGDRAKTSTAPNVEGMDIATARDRWRAQNILVIEDGSRVDTGVSPGTILTQIPSAGAVMERPELRVIVARAPDLTGVPNVLDQKIEDARETLVQAGFEVPPETREASDERAGTVIAQDPNPGAQSERGGIVRLTVAAALVEVPRLYGKPLDRARKDLEKAGLSLGEVSQREDPELSGRRVLSQVPDAGERVERGTTVNLVIVAPD